MYRIFDEICVIFINCPTLCIFHHPILDLLSLLAVYFVSKGPKLLHLLYPLLGLKSGPKYNSTLNLAKK